MITSALAGDGTSITANPALMIAASGMSVCLVEADLRRPRISLLLDLESGARSDIGDDRLVNLDQAVQERGDRRPRLVGRAPAAQPVGASQQHGGDESSRPAELRVRHRCRRHSSRAGRHRCRCGERMRRRHRRRCQPWSTNGHPRRAARRVRQPRPVPHPGVILNRLPTAGPDAIVLTELGYIVPTKFGWRTGCVGCASDLVELDASPPVTLVLP